MLTKSEFYQMQEFPGELKNILFFFIYTLQMQWFMWQQLKKKKDLQLLL